MSTTHRCWCMIAEDHPCLPGHFPDNPIVPGVVILDTVVSELKQIYGARTLVFVPAVKFSAPLFPGQRFELVATGTEHEHGDLRVAFRCRREPLTLAHGKLTLRMGDA